MILQQDLLYSLIWVHRSAQCPLWAFANFKPVLRPTLFYNLPLTRIHAMVTNVITVIKQQFLNQVTAEPYYEQKPRMLLRHMVLFFIKLQNWSWWSSDWTHIVTSWQSPPVLSIRNVHIFSLNETCTHLHTKSVHIFLHNDPMHTIMVPAGGVLLTDDSISPVSALSLGNTRARAQWQKRSHLLSDDQISQLQGEDKKKLWEFRLVRRRWEEIMCEFRWWCEGGERKWLDYKCIWESFMKRGCTGEGTRRRINLRSRWQVRYQESCCEQCHPWW